LLREEETDVVRALGTLEDRSSHGGLHRSRMVKGRSLAENTPYIKELCGVPNGTRQTTEHPLSFTIDLLVEAA
jgi:hypothetical protein